MSKSFAWTSYLPVISEIAVTTQRKLDIMEAYGSLKELEHIKRRSGPTSLKD